MDYPSKRVGEVVHTKQTFAGIQMAIVVITHRLNHLNSSSFNTNNNHAEDLLSLEVRVKT
ncbi:hypothetical protein FTX61_27835 [Nitriliruptoraceae bacterium ZYF776]|nr:hypothetical protein [Profundirhabdus halotolerans]